MKFDINILAEHINNLKHGNKKFISNAYFSTVQLDEKISSKNCSIHLDEEFISIIEDNNSFSRLYFYIRSHESIPQLIQHLNDMGRKIIATDIVGKNSSAQTIADSLCQHGFIPYANYSRWKTNSPKRSLKKSPSGVNIELAKDGDTGEILEILTNTFDPVTAHLPSIERIHSGIENDEIFVIKKSNCISALLWVDNIGSKSKYIYQAVVQDRFKGNGYGTCLFDFIFNFYDKNTTYTNWSDDKNDAINSIFKYFGFKKEGIVNYVLKLENYEGENNGKDI